MNTTMIMILILLDFAAVGIFFTLLNAGLIIIILYFLAKVAHLIFRLSALAA